MAVDESKKISFFHGKEADIQSKIDDGTITPADFIVTSDSDSLVYVDSDKSQHVLGNAKSKEAHVANLGTGGSVGGIKDGDTIDADTDLDTLIKKIITKQVLPTYTSPKLTLTRTSGDAAGNHEIGETVKVTLTASFTQNDAGALTAIAINDGTNDVLTGTTSPLVLSDHEIKAGTGTTTFKATATYGDGAAKQDNLGEDDTEHIIKGGTITSSTTVSFSGKRRAFFGSGAGTLDGSTVTSAEIRALTDTVLNPVNGTVHQFDIPAGIQHIVFAYPSTLEDVKQVKYVDLGDTGMASSFVKSTTQVADAAGENATDYKVYIYNLSSATKEAMKYEVTI